MSATGLSGVMYQKLVAGDTFNVGAVLNDQQNRMIERMIIECNTAGGGGAINIQLPTWASLQSVLNFEISIVDTGNNAGTNNIIITPGSGNTINNNATYTINTNKGGIFLIAGTPSNWSGFVALNSNTSSGGGSGTLTNFSSGNLSPLFTTSVATPTTTPAQTFSLANAETNFVFAGPASGSPGAPTYRSLVKDDYLIQSSDTLDFPNTLAGTSSDLTITLTGAALGNIVMIGVPQGSTQVNSCYTAWVSAVNLVTVRFNNYSVDAIDPASGTFTVAVFK